MLLLSGGTCRRVSQTGLSRMQYNTPLFLGHHDYHSLDVAYLEGMGVSVGFVLCLFCFSSFVFMVV